MTTTTVPDSPEAMAEALANPEQAGEIFGDPEKRKLWLDSYTQAVNARDPDLLRQEAESRRAGLRQFADKPVARRLPMGGEEDGALLASVPVDELYRPLGLTRKDLRQLAATGRGPGVALVGKHKTFGEFLQAVPALTGQINPAAIRNDMNESVLSEGGALVPEEFRAEMLALSLEGAVVRPRARVIPMAAASVRLPAVIDASHASTVFGGVSAAWTAEGASLGTGTQPSFGQVALTARKLTGLTVASNELLADSAISLEALVMAMFGEALGYFEDDAFLSGTGAGQPLGVLNAPALVTVAKETGQAATTLLYENIVKMFARVLPQSMGRGIWYANPDIFPQLAQLSLAVGTGGSAIWISNVADGPPATIFGRPVIFTEKAKSLGTAGDIVFADFGYYLIGDRQALSISASPHVNFATDEMVWRFVQRVDGRPWLLSALTPRNGTNTLSPFVSLATRS